MFLFFKIVKVSSSETWKVTLKENIYRILFEKSWLKLQLFERFVTRKGEYFPWGNSSWLESHNKLHSKITLSLVPLILPLRIVN